MTKKSFFKYLKLLLIFPVLGLLFFAVCMMRSAPPLCRQSIYIDADKMRNTESTCQVFTQSATSLKAGRRVKDKHLLAMGKKVGDSVSFEFQVETPGRYLVEIYLPRAPGHGVVDLSVNDSQGAQKIDLFSSTGGGDVMPVNLGEHDLLTKNTLRIEVSGCNPAGSDPHYQWVFDKIRITKSLGLFEKVVSGQLFKETVVSDQLSAEDAKFLNRIKMISPRDKDSVEEKATTEKIVQLLGKTTSRELQGEIYYKAGRFNFHRQNYGPAMKYLKKAIKTSPEFHGNPRKTPAISFMNTSAGEYSLSVVKGLIRSVFLVLILIVIGLYFVTKPWQWVTMKQLIMILLLISGSICMFLLIGHFTDKMIVPSTDYFSAPIFSNEHLGGFDSGITTSIMKFYVTAVIGILIAVLPLSRVRFRFFKMVVSLVLALTIFSGVMGLFCFRQNGSKSHSSVMSFQFNKESAFPYLTGEWFWSAKDFKPYVISDPRKFMDLDFYLSNEPIFKKWVTDKYSKINSLSDNDESKNK